MPWTGQSFQKHNASLSPGQSSHAAAIANHVLASTGNEGEAVATANKLIHRDYGGMVPAASPGLAPSVANQQPNVQGILQRLSQMQPEQLRELIPRLPGQMQQLAQRVLQGKQMMPQSNQPSQQPQQALPQFGVPAQPQALPQPMPVQPVQQPIQQQAAGGSVHQVPWPTPRFGPGHLPVGQARFFAHGGGMGHAHHTGMSGRDDTVPILAAGGEFVVAPHHVARLGDGDIKAGHKWLDEFVVKARKDIVDTMRRLKPPVKS